MVTSPQGELDNCYRGIGTGYRGTASSAISGLICQPWTSSDILRHYDSDIAEYAEALGDHNYCRNPGNEENAPWCFVFANQSITRAVCDIPRCHDESTVQPWITEVLIYALFPCLTLPLCFGFILFLIHAYRRTEVLRTTSTSTTYFLKPSIMTEDSGEAPSGSRRRGFARSVGSAAVAGLVPSEIPANSLRVLREMGEGSFGKVLEAELILYSRATRVGIRTLRDDATVDMSKHFWREIRGISGLRHHNIICLLGVCTRQQPLCMVFDLDYCFDLHECLALPSVVNPFHRALASYGTKVYFCYQVASGLEHMAGRCYVHRDIAARNVFIAKTLTAKISLLDVARSKYASDYCAVPAIDVAIAVRWSSPDVLRCGQWSVKTDLWSFGCLLWEVFSGGSRPFSGYSDDDVRLLVSAGHRPVRPTDCPDAIHALMIRCWDERHQSCIEDVRQGLEQLLQTMTVAADAQTRKEDIEVPSDRYSRFSDVDKPRSVSLENFHLTDRVVAKEQAASIQKPRGVALDHTYSRIFSEVRSTRA